MKIKGKYELLAILVMAVLILGVVSGCSNEAATENGKPKIRVGYFPNITHPQALVGFNKGAFQKALGNEVIIEEHIFNAGPSEVLALLAGEIDLGYIGPVPAINGYLRSKGDLKIIAGAVNGGAIMVSRKDFLVKDIKEFNGKKIAIPQLGNTQDISLRNLLQQANLKVAVKGGSVTVVPAENADIMTLLTRGDIDGALVPEPWGSRLVKEAGANVVLDSSQIWRDGNYATTVVIASTKFLEENPELVKKWLQAHVELTESLNKDKETSKQTINNQLNKLTQKALPLDVLDSSFDRIQATYNPEAGSINEFVDISAANGYLKGEPDISGLLQLDILNQVLKEKGLPGV